MKTFIKSALQNILLLTVVIAILFALLESYCRIFLPYPFSHDRALLFSSPLMQVRDSRSVAFIPNTFNREVAVYEDRIEYDIRYRTNDLGYISDTDYIPGLKDPDIKSHIALVGDSFVAGSGYGDWVSSMLKPSLQDRDVQLYNLGVMGTGFLHFEALLKHASRYIPITHIVIAAISSDFYRPHWIPVTKDEGIYFCDIYPDDRLLCRDRHLMMSFIDADADHDHIFEAAQQQHMKKHGRKMSGTGARKALSIHFAAHVRLLLDRMSEEKRRASEAADSHKKPDVGLAVLSRLKDRYPDIPITFIHLPQRGESVTKKYRFDVRRDIEKLGIRYISALDMEKWSFRDYLTIDPHPNQEGYRKISGIFRETLSDLVSGSAAQ